MGTMGMEGKVVLMTGGSGALGQTVIPAFVSAGARVIAGDLQPLSRLPAEVTMPGAFTPEQKKLLEAAAHACPVHKSLHADIEAPITFAWGS